MNGELSKATPWFAGFAHRWHIHPTFAATRDRVDGHSHRVCVLVLMLEPNASAALLRATIVHDLGESQVGDIAYPVKKNRPDLMELLEADEKAAIRAMGFPNDTLFPNEQKILNLADRLDAYLWALHHDTKLVQYHPAWLAHKEHVLNMACEIGKSELVADLIDAVAEGIF